jgi:hypothetical protein
MNALASKFDRNANWSHDSLQDRGEESQRLKFVRIDRLSGIEIATLKKYQVGETNVSLCNLGDIWAASQKKWNLYGGVDIILQDSDITISCGFKDMTDYGMVSEPLPQPSPNPFVGEHLERYCFSIAKVVDKTSKLEKEFNELSGTWYRETRMLSFARQKALHPCYQKIIGMGKDALPFIFRELQNGKGDWMWAIESIARLPDNPVPKGATYKDAVNVWLQWARANGYI